MDLENKTYEECEQIWVAICVHIAEKLVMNSIPHFQKTEKFMEYRVDWSTIDGFLESSFIETNSMNFTVCGSMILGIMYIQIAIYVTNVEQDGNLIHGKINVVYIMLCMRYDFTD